MDLQTAFYIIGIVFMGIMIVLIVGILAAILAIKAKIKHLHDAVDDRIQSVQRMFSIGAPLLRVVRHLMR